MRYWSVASALLADDRGLLLVANKRQGGAIDWSTPGGVVDEGETSIMALEREVVEETGLVVETWSALCWTVAVDFIDLNMHLDVEVHAAAAFTGRISLDDPDQIVTAAKFVSADTALRLLAESPMWVAEPLCSWITEPWIGSSLHFGYLAHGTNPSEMSAERIPL